jgi:NADH:ubiquinone oxidoreductase subunit E
MALLKYIDPTGWDFDAPSAQLVKVAADGRLHAQDRRDFIKRASGSENVFLPYLDRVKLAADETPVHLIALGALEAYGPNRNGDGFREKALKQYHPTFVKYARFYRNHKNKNPEHSYGVVKLAAYNPTMRRVELLVALNGSEKAAQRNGGFVADQELEKLARGEDIPVSMACRVPYDECSYCGNRARTRAEYCKAASCGAGGCAENLTKLVKVGNDVHHLFVHNDHPLFFDISAVFRPADRIAWGSRADWLNKQASDWSIDEAAPWRSRLSEVDLSPAGDHPFARLIPGLAAVEKQAAWPVIWEQAFRPKVQPPIDWSRFPGQIKQAQLLNAMAEAQIVLPLYDFARLTGQTAAYSQAARQLPNAYRRLAVSSEKQAAVAASPWARLDQAGGFSLLPRLGEALAPIIPSHSLRPEWVFHRVKLAGLRPPVRLKTTFEKTATDGQRLLTDYLAYQLSALGRIASHSDDFVLTARFSACQNRAVGGA